MYSRSLRKDFWKFHSSRSRIGFCFFFFFVFSVQKSICSCRFLGYLRTTQTKKYTVITSTVYRTPTVIDYNSESEKKIYIYVNTRRYWFPFVRQVAVQVAVGEQDASARRAEKTFGIRTGGDGRHDRGTAAGNPVHGRQDSGHQVSQFAATVVQTENLFVSAGQKVSRKVVVPLQHRRWVLSIFERWQRGRTYA